MYELQEQTHEHTQEQAHEQAYEQTHEQRQEQDMSYTQWMNVLFGDEGGPVCNTLIEVILFFNLQSTSNKKFLMKCRCLRIKRVIITIKDCLRSRRTRWSKYNLTRQGMNQ